MEATFHKLEATLLPIYGTFFPVHGTLHPIYGTFLPVYGTLLPIHGTFLPVHGTFLPVHGTLLPIHGTFLPVYGTLHSAEATFLPDDGVILAEERLSHVRAATLIVDEALLFRGDATVHPEHGSVCPRQASPAPSEAPLHSESLLSANPIISNNFRHFAPVSGGIPEAVDLAMEQYGLQNCTSSKAGAQFAFMLGDSHL